MPQSSTQQFLEIDKVKEGIVLLRNGSLRGVIMISSLNFALKSDDEQQAIVYQFQNFLNSLDFPIEISVQSRKLNITGYLDKLEELEKNQANELLKIQTGEYRKFIKDLIAGGEILSKSFFAVIPFTMLNLPNAPNLPGMKKVMPTVSVDDDQFQRAKAQLWQRMEFVAMGLRRCGLKCIPLNTPELIELFWGIYHPEEAEVGYFPEIPSELTQ